jgi:hypothetical protein
MLRLGGGFLSDKEICVLGKEEREAVWKLPTP